MRVRVQRGAVSELQMRHGFGGPEMGGDLDASRPTKYGPRRVALVTRADVGGGVGLDLVRASPDRRQRFFSERAGPGAA
jgi:hypothetical protein